jgi:hypothetical protein
MKKTAVKPRNPDLEHRVQEFLRRFQAYEERATPLKAIIVACPCPSPADLLLALEALIKDGVVACAGDDEYRIASPPSGPGKMAALERRIARLEAIVSRLDREVGSITTTY